MTSRTPLLGLIAVLALATPAFAGPRDILRAMSKCSAIADNTARLACYDSLKPQIDAVLQLPAPPPPAPLASPEERFGMDHKFAGGTSDKPQTTPEQFGSERLSKDEQDKIYQPDPGQPEVKELESISATLTDYAFNGYGFFVVFLDNGQVWRENDTDHILFKKAPKDNHVVISRDFLGSYSLKLNDQGRIYKVKRVK